MSSTIAKDFVSHIPYLARDELYLKEKPYGADFPVYHIKDSNPSNHIFDDRTVTIRDIRNVTSPTLERNGFCFLKSDIKLSEDEASENDTPTMKLFLHEIETLLQKEFPEYSRVEIMDFQVCERFIVVNILLCSI